MLSSRVLLRSSPAAGLRVVPARVTSQGLARLPLAPRPLSTKARSSKSWGEIFSDLGGVAKSVGDKLKETVADVGSAITKAGTPEQEKPMRVTPPPPQGGLLPQLFGRAVGGLVGAALSGLSKELEEAGRQQQKVYADASHALKSSQRVRDRFGPDVVVGPVVSQSSSSMSINGRTSKQVVLVVPLQGQFGSGNAQVQYRDGVDGSGMNITVQAATGEVFTVGGGDAASGAGRVIDAEFREIK